MTAIVRVVPEMPVNVPFSTTVTIGLQFGPVANLAGRLGSHASSGQTLISQRVVAEVDTVVETALVGELELKGIDRPVAAYEVRGLR